VHQLFTNFFCLSNLKLKLKSKFLLILVGVACTSMAQDLSTQNDANTSSETQLSYTIGMRIKSNDFSDAQQTPRLRPVIGLRYGKWQLGIGDGRTWSKAGAYGAEPTLSYQFIDDPDVNIGLSMRAHNVSTGEAFDVFEGGKTTLRTRLMFNRKIAEQWRMNIDWTQDILNKGDSSTINFGVSYSWPVFKQSELVLNLGTTWATAEHWRHANLPELNSSHHVFVTGFEKVNAGLTFKQPMSKNWAWFSTIGVSKPIANLKLIQGNSEVVSGQIGFLYFKR